MSIRLDDKTIAALRAIARADGCSVAAVQRKALQGYLGVRKLDALRAKMIPKARAAGIFTDEDVMRLLDRKK